MAVTELYSRAFFGIEAFEVMVEVSVMPGQSRFHISGMPKAAVRQAEHRVRVAIDCSRFKFPFGRITINLSPADIPKDGGRFDLAIAIGLLVNTRQLEVKNLNSYEFYAELGLNGELRSVPGIIPCAASCSQRKRIMVISHYDAPSAVLVKGLKTLVGNHLLGLSAHFSGLEPLPDYQPIKPDRAHPMIEGFNSCDLQDIIGQERTKRALVIAAAGGHHMLMIGPPGAGKTMLARSMPGLLPPLSESEALEVTAIYSSSRGSPQSHLAKNLSQLLTARPFRAPHHTISASALIGGGSLPVPGEISLSHHGVLFLDELTEFNSRVLDSMRQSIESGRVVVSRVQGRAEFPARFQLLAAMNPCPCGYLGDPHRECGACDRMKIIRYQNKLSGPILDRLDLQIEVRKESLDPLPNRSMAEWTKSSEVARRCVLSCRQKQLERQGCINGRLSEKGIKTHCTLKPELQSYFLEVCERLHFSRRAYSRVLLVARTLADIAEAQSISQEHIKESITYRQMDRRQQIGRRGEAKLERIGAY